MAELKVVKCSNVCLQCDEPVTEQEQKTGQQTTLMTKEGAELRGIHRECMLRSAIGSVGHQNGKCFCFGGDEEDPPNMTKREAAKEACRLYESRNNVKLKESLRD